MKKIGKTQENVLRALKEHRGWSRGCDWTWSTDNATERILTALVNRGLVKRENRERGLYYSFIENPKPYKRFTVSCEVIRCYTLGVNAASEEDAIKMVREMDSGEIADVASLKSVDVDYVEVAK